MFIHKLLKLFLFVSLLGLLFACGENQQHGKVAPAEKPAAQAYNWRMVTTWPPNFPIFQEGVERFAQDVKTLSGGKLNIKVFAGGELVPPLQTFDAVSR